jgi:hypothetical protein
VIRAFGTALLACIVCNTGFTAETVLHGTITDKSTGEPLGYAHVRIEGRLQGTVANAQGEYELRLESLPADISVSYIGYKAERRHIEVTTPATIDIALTPEPVVFETIEVTPEDPAVRIMREVIRRKKEWRTSLETWRADGYTRVNLANDVKIASILESVSKLNWDVYNGMKETILAKRQTENVGIEQNIAMARIMPNLYDDNIEIIGFDIIGLTNPDALDCYDFKLIGRRQRDGKTVFDISVTPKKKLQPSFVGTLSVLDGEFAMIEAKVKPNDVVIFPAPLNNFAISIEQQFDNYGGSYWLPADVRVDGSLKLKLPGLNFPTINYQQLTRLTGFEINVVPPDSIQKRRERKVSMNVKTSSNSISISAGVSERTGDAPEPERSGERAPIPSSSARKSGESAVDNQIESTQTKTDSLTAIVKKAAADSIFTASPSVVPYTAEEQKAYAQIDSTDKLEDAFKPTGVLARMMDTGNREKKPKKEPSPLGKAVGRVLSPFSPRVSANRVDDYALGLAFGKQLFDRIDLNLVSMYRRAPDDWTWGGTLGYRFGKRNRWSASVSAGDNTGRTFPGSAYPGLLNSANVLTGREDYFDYFDSRSFRAAVGRQFGWKNMSVEGAVRSEKFSSRTAVAKSNVLANRVIQHVNPRVDEGNLRSLGLTLRLGDGVAPLGIAGGNRALLNVEYTSPDMFDSDFSFTRYEMTVDHRFDTFFRRRLLPNTLDIRAIGGRADGRLPYQRFGGFDTAFGVLAPFGVMRSMRNRPVVGEQYAAIFAEHNFRTVPFEIIGFDWLARKGIGLIATGAAGWTWNDRVRVESMGYPVIPGTSTMSEVGLGLSGLFGLGRIDVTKRLDRHGVSFGIGLARIL